MGSIAYAASLRTVCKQGCVGLVLNYFSFGARRLVPGYLLQFSLFFSLHLSRSLCLPLSLLVPLSSHLARQTVAVPTRPVMAKMDTCSKALGYWCDTCFMCLTHVLGYTMFKATQCLGYTCFRLLMWSRSLVWVLFNRIMESLSCIAKLWVQICLSSLKWTKCG